MKKLCLFFIVLTLTVTSLSAEKLSAEKLLSKSPYNYNTFELDYELSVSESLQRQFDIKHPWGFDYTAKTLPFWWAYYSGKKSLYMPAFPENTFRLSIKNLSRYN